MTTSLQLTFCVRHKYLSFKHFRYDLRLKRYLRGTGWVFTVESNHVSIANLTRKLVLMNCCCYISFLYSQVRILVGIFEQLRIPFSLHTRERPEDPSAKSNFWNNDLVPVGAANRFRGIDSAKTLSDWLERNTISKEISNLCLVVLSDYLRVYQTFLYPEGSVCYDLSGPATCSDLRYRGEACQPLDLDLVDLEVKGHFRIRKVEPEVWCSRK